MLAYMLNRLSGLEWPVIVATTDKSADDAIADTCGNLRVPVVRGDESDVLARFAQVLKLYPADDVIRLTGDCPLIDPALVSDITGVHLRLDADYTSNTLIRTYPDGLDVEVMRSSALLEANAASVDPYEREHVAPYIYLRNSRFSLAAATASEYRGHLRWTVDTREDLHRVRRIAARARSHEPSWEELLGRLDPDLREPFTDGVAPALRSGELPPGTRPDDPTNPMLSLLKSGQHRASIAVQVVDGRAEICPHGDLRGADRQLVEDHVTHMAHVTQAHWQDL